MARIAMTAAAEEIGLKEMVAFIIRSPIGL